MLKPVPRKNRNIRQVVRKNHQLLLEQEAGVIRIWPQTDKIIRVSYSETGEFAKAQGEGFADLSADCTWDFTQNEAEICVITRFLQVKINCRTGAIRYEKPDGTCLLAEAEQESKRVEKFDVYKTVMNENAQIEAVETADGIKRRIREADSVFEKNLYHTKLSLQFAEDEKLFGLGQAEEGVWNLRHTTQYLHQANLKIAVPLLVSDRKYGILLSTQSTAVFSDTQYGSGLYTEADEYLDYYFLAGDSLDEVIGGFRSLTGKASMLPRWAFGYMQSQERYETAEEIEETVSKFREKGIGLDSIVLDWMSWKGNLWGQKTFDESRFPDPDGMTERLHEKKVHFMISIWPNMNEDGDNYREFADRGLLLPGSGIYDAFSEEGRRLYWEQANKGLFCHGVDAWWCDSSEPVTPEWERRQKPEPWEMYREFVDAAGKCMPLQKINAYGRYHAQAIYEGQRGTTEQKRVVNLTRNGYTGSQKYGTILWSGDTYASWETLKKQIAAGLQFSASGLPYWTLDIGAFFVKKGMPWFWNGDYEEGNADMGYRELYVRWYQYGAFLPIFRSHGTDCRREPWNFGEAGDPFYEALLAANRQRYELMPYIYSLAGNVWHNNGTMLRMLAFDFPEDKKATEIADEFLFGPSLLVCPVTQPMYFGAGSVPAENAEKSRKVYLPAGTDWYDLRTGEKLKGGQVITASADISSIPVFVRAGSVIPMQKAADSTEWTEESEIILRVYGGADGSFTLYEDAGDGYGYEKGEYCLTTFTYCDASGTVEGKTEGDLRFRRGKIKVEKRG